MPLYIKDDRTAELVTQLARLRGVSKQDAMKDAIQAALNQAAEAVPLRDRLAALRKAHPLPPETGERRREGLLRRAVRRPVVIFVEASPLIAMIAGEKNADDLADRLQADPQRLCSAVSVWETVAGLCRSYTFSVATAREHVGGFLEAGGFQCAAIGERELESRSKPTRSSARGGTRRR